MNLNRGVVLLLLVAGIVTPPNSLWSEEEKPLQTAQAGSLEVPSRTLISLDFKDASIQTILDILARKANINIVAGKGVSETVTIHLDNVTWEQALETISNTYGLGYERQNNIIVVMTSEELKARREAAKALIDAEPIITKVIHLKYLDASDVSKFIEPQLSPQGKVSVVEITGQKGWAFGTGQAAGSSTSSSAQVGQRKEREKARSKAVVITDTVSTIERFEKILAEIDVMPQLILIQARVMEVSRDLLRDLGVEMGTGSSSTTVDSTHGFNAATGSRTFSQDHLPNNKRYGGSLLSQVITPSTFVPSATGLTAANSGLSFLFQQLRGAKLELLLRALEEDARTNTLSSPHILTLSGQEAKILVGTKYPILKTDVSGTSSTTTSTSLDYYQDIGIELFVVPQVSGEHHIDMIIHPIVSSRTSTVGTNAYPVLDIREAETQVIVEQGDTVVIGGLLKDVKSKSRVGIPFLGKLPFVGPLFARTTVDSLKLDLLIFISARVVDPGTFPAEDLSTLQEDYEKFLSGKLTSLLKKETVKNLSVQGTSKVQARTGSPLVSKVSPAAPPVSQVSAETSPPAPEAHQPLAEKADPSFVVRHKNWRTRPSFWRVAETVVPAVAKKSDAVVLPRTEPVLPWQSATASGAPKVTVLVTPKPAAPNPARRAAETASLDELTRIQNEYKKYLTQKKKMDRKSSVSTGGNRGIIYQNEE